MLIEAHPRYANCCLNEQISTHRSMPTISSKTAISALKTFLLFQRNYKTNVFSFATVKLFAQLVLLK